MSPPLIATHPPSSASANMPPNRHNIHKYILWWYTADVSLWTTATHKRTPPFPGQKEHVSYTCYYNVQYTQLACILFLLHALHAPLACLLASTRNHFRRPRRPFFQPPTTHRKFAGKCVACALDGVLWSVFFLFNTHHWMWGSSVALLLVGELSWQPKNHHPPPSTTANFIQLAAKKRATNITV